MASDVQVRRVGDRISISIALELPEGTAMMECERAIQDALNEAGKLLTGECLERFDTDGSPIEVGGINFTSKGRVGKAYQTPYGEVSVPRHVYQSGWGGATYCPLDRSARVIESTTPRFAQMCARKYATLNSTLAQEDLAECHQRHVSRCYLQDTAEAVAAIAQDKQPIWKYADAVEQTEVAFISLSIDGTCVLYCEEGWRTAMVGTLSLYDALGERLQTIYVGAPPAYGKESFLEQMQREIAIYKERYPGVLWVGVADGAKDYWPWLERFVHVQMLDFWHAVSYLETAAAAMHRSSKQRRAWFERSRHALKHEHGAAEALLEEMNEAARNPRLGSAARAHLQTAAGYFANNLSRMNYAEAQARHWPLGSGVTEAACKTLVKQRMCGSGMKWKHDGAATVLSLRSLVLSTGRWQQFWSKISRFGV
jgi:hypothetical protein